MLLACRARLLPFALLTLSASSASSVLFARPAAAQVITETNNQGPLDYLSDYTTPSTHPNNISAQWISYADCESDVVVELPLTVSPPSSGDLGTYTIAAFATTSGADCGAEDANRTGTDAVCWQVGVGKGDLPTVPAATVLTAYVPVRDILRNLSQSTGPGLPLPGTEAACHADKLAGVTPVSLWFMVFPNSTLTGVPPSELEVGLNAELVGPAPPTLSTIGIGDGLLILNWTPSTDTTTYGYNIFIDPLPGHETSADLASSMSPDAAPYTTTVCNDGGSPDAGMDAGCHVVTLGPDASAQFTTCPSKILVGTGVTGTTIDDASVDSSVSTVIEDSGLDASTTTTTTLPGTTTTGTAPTPAQIALIDGPEQIIGSTVSTKTITGLKNGYVYTIAMSSIDGLNDNGPISGPECATPSPVNDFFTDYVNDGGLAGGGFCAVEQIGAPAGLGALGLLALSLSLSLARRRRRR
jgi:hypothetical protein